MDTDRPPDRPRDQVVRHGRVAWLTRPPEGTAHMGVESRAFGAIALSVPESDPVPSEATPGELLAVTHGFFMAWALAEALLGRGSQADELVVATDCTFAGPLDKRELVAVDLDVRARVPGLEPAVFADVVALARRRYLQAAGLREDVAGEVHAELLASE